jgi:hypothetical protein
VFFHFFYNNLNTFYHFTKIIHFAPLSCIHLTVSLKVSVPYKFKVIDTTMLKHRRLFRSQSCGFECSISKKQICQYIPCLCQTNEVYNRHYPLQYYKKRSGLLNNPPDLLHLHSGSENLLLMYNLFRLSRM